MLLVLDAELVCYQLPADWRDCSASTKAELGYYVVRGCLSTGSRCNLWAPLETGKACLTDIFLGFLLAGSPFV